MNARSGLVSREISQEIWEKIGQVREVSWRNFGKRIRFYVPSFSYYENRYFRSSPMLFPSISLTGSYCALNCKHCGGEILKTMISAQTPRELIRVCREVEKKGGVGCLISGGCIPDGSVPINKFVNALAEIKSRLKLKLVVHTGLINLETAQKLKEAGIDAVLIDIIGSDNTIREIYHLNISASAYEESLRALSRSNIPFVPHVLVGLHYGRIVGETKALELIAKSSPSALILIVFFPLKGTIMENMKPPAPESVIEVLVQARSMMPRVPLVLGCARPKGRHRIITDSLAVEAGVNAIAFPAREAISRAELLRLEATFSPLCCSQVYEDITFL